VNKYFHFLQIYTLTKSSLLHSLNSFVRELLKLICLGFDLKIPIIKLFWIENKNILANDKKLDITTFHEDGVPVHSVDLHAACPRCLAAEASKPGHNDGEC
jgi:hypothetical protein